MQRQPGGPKQNDACSPKMPPAPAGGGSLPARRFSASPIVDYRSSVSLICEVGGQRCSRRGRAAASLPAGLVHRLPRPSPPPSLAVAVIRQGRAPLRPSGRLASRARPPRRASLPASGAGRTTAARRPARPSGILVLFFCPVPADFAAFGLPVLGCCGRLRYRINPRTLRSAASVWCSGPSADRRCALIASALRLFQTFARFRSGLASFGRARFAG